MKKLSILLIALIFNQTNAFADQQCRIAIAIDGQAAGMQKAYGLAPLADFSKSWKVKVFPSTDKAYASNPDAVLHLTINKVNPPEYHEYYVKGATYTVTGFIDYRRLGIEGSDYTEGTASSYFLSIVDTDNETAYFRDPYLKALKEFSSNLKAMLPKCK